MKYIGYLLILTSVVASCSGLKNNSSLTVIKKGTAEYYLPNKLKIEVVVSAIHSHPLEEGKTFKAHNVSCFIHNKSDQTLYEPTCRITVNSKNGNSITRSLSFSSVKPNSKSETLTKTFLVPIASPIKTIEPQLLLYAPSENEERENVEPRRVRHH